MAERQGLLHQRHLSGVQTLALVTLNHLDEIESGRRKWDALKLSLVATGKFKHQELFPDYFPEAVEEQKPDAALPTDSPADLTAVEWKTGSDALAEYNRMMDALRNAGSGQLNGELMSDSDEMWTEWR